MEKNRSINETHQKRRLKSAFIRLQRNSESICQFSVNILNEINNQLKPKHEAMQNSEIKDDPQPSPSKIKLKATKVQSIKEIKQHWPIHRKMQKKRSLERLSVETRLHNLEQKNYANNRRPLSCFKFPSQTTLLSKQKVIPITPKQKQKYVVEICRIFKQNCNTIYQENTKEHEAFKESQAKKLKNCQSQKSKTPPILAFNYDGSIMTITPVKKVKIQSIQCVGVQLQGEVVQPLNEDYAKDKIKAPVKSLDACNYEKLEEIQSDYIQNFQRIKWNPKITVEYSSKFRPSFRKSRDLQNVLLLNQQFQSRGRNRNRANTLSVNRPFYDQKSKIKIYSSQAYEQHLLTKPVQINGKRSYLPNYSETINIEKRPSQNIEDNKSNFLKCIMEQRKNQVQSIRENTKRSNKIIVNNNNVLLVPEEKTPKEEINHIRCRSADFREIKSDPPKQKMVAYSSSNKVHRQKKVTVQKESKQVIKKFQLTKGMKQVRKQTRLRPSYDLTHEKWKS